MPPKTPKNKNPWQKSNSLRLQYERQLRKIGREVGRVIEGYRINNPSDARKAQDALQRYADLLAPWATHTARTMLSAADLQDQRAWRIASKEIGVNLRREIETASIGAVFRQLMEEQVTLITSLPIVAGQRVHALATEAMINGERAGEIAKEIARSGEVTESRAMTIARTETSRASSVLTQARAQSIGSDGYVWRSAKDSRVRESHRKLEGKVIEWNHPPECDPGYHAHAGCIFNCRCWCEVIIPRRVA